MISSTTIYQRYLALVFLRQSRASLFTATHRARLAPIASTFDKVKSHTDGDSQLYTTRQDFERSIKDSRINREATEETGIAPTAIQKTLLLATFLYSSRAHIPKYVPYETMQRMHDRSRVLFLATATTVFLTIIFIYEDRMTAKVVHDKTHVDGKVLTKHF